jgi:hypothetical protein
MRKISTLLLFAILFDLAANSQTERSFFKEFEIGGEVGVTLDYLISRDPAGNMIRAKGLQSGLRGPRVRKYFDKHFFTELAFLWKENSFGFQYKQQPPNSNFTSSSSQSFIIPFRVGYDLHMTDNFSFTVLGGIVPSFIKVHYDIVDHGNDYAENIYVQYQTRDEYKRSYITIQPGALLSYLIEKRVRFSLGVNYYHGFSDVEYYDINYRINNGPIQSGVIASRGSFISYNAGLSYLFDFRKKVE